MSDKTTHYVFHEPEEYGFRNVNGHDGKFFGTNSLRSNHLIIECHDKLTVRLLQHESEFSYYIIEGSGEFVFGDNETNKVNQGDVVVIPPGAIFTFRGELKMLLINTPQYTPKQEKVVTL